MLQTFDPPAVPLYATEKSIPLLLILPTFCTAGSAAPADAGVGRLVLFPLDIRVPQRNLPEAGLDARLRSPDVVERIAGAAAEFGDDAATGNVLVPGDAPAEPQHHVRQEAVLREERFP